MVSSYHSCQRKACSSCFLFTWLVLLAGCGLHHYALWLLLPGLQRFPQNFEAGWNDALGFARLDAELQQVASSARAALAICGVVAEEQCSDSEVVAPFPAVASETAAQKREIEMAFNRTLATVQRVTSDMYLGTEAFSPTASHLSSISMNIASVSYDDQPCSESVGVYCAIHRSEEEAQAELEEVLAEVERLSARDELEPLESAGPYLRYFHAFPYLAVVPMLLSAWWVWSPRDPSARGKLRCWPMAVQCVVCFIFVLALSLLTLPGLWLLLEPKSGPLWWLSGAPTLFFRDLWSNVWPCYLLRSEPPLLPLLVHVRAEFPEFWDAVFGDMGDGPELLLWATITVQVSFLLMLVLGMLAKMCTLPQESPSVADLVRDISCDGAWPDAPAGEIKELRGLTPCQLEALLRVRQQCRALHLKALPLLLKRAKRLGSSEQDVRRTLTWIRERAPIIIHVDLEAYGSMLAADTHYRNQFETNLSRGTLDHGKRSRWEDELFGKAYNGAAAFERCKYGALNVINDPQGVRSCRQYGLNYLLLKGVRLRTTFSATDSAGISSEHLATVDYFAHVLNQFKDAELTRALAVGTQKVQGADSGVLYSYKEAQVHGEIRLADHVALIMAHTSLHRRGAEDVLRRLAERCRAEVIWIEGGIDQPPGSGPAVPLLTPSAPVHSNRVMKASSQSSRQGPRAPVAAGEVWEAQGDNGWTPYEGAALVAIREASAAGQRLARFEARGFDYEIDLELGRQHNLTTGRWRAVRRAE